ncbi:hypothetical protein SMICM304S_06087 [Streptomyces microflavus]
MTASAPGRSFAADPIVEPAELPLGWAAQLVSCVVDENVGLPDAAVLMYRDPDHDLLSESGITLGTPLMISVVTVQDRVRERLFTGEVTAIELDHDTTGTFTVIRALSKAHRLQRGRKVVAYRNMKTADIVRKVAAGAGLACGKVEAAPITYKQLTQPNVSDWEFLQHLAAESGAQVRVDDLGVLQFTKPKPASSAPSPTTRAAKNPMVLEYGDNLLSLRAVVTGADGAGDVEVRGWNVDTKTRLVAREQSVRSTTVIPGMRPTVATGPPRRGHGLPSPTVARAGTSGSPPRSRRPLACPPVRRWRPRAGRRRSRWCSPPPRTCRSCRASWSGWSPRRSPATRPTAPGRSARARTSRASRRALSRVTRCCSGCPPPCPGASSPYAWTAGWRAWASTRVSRRWCGRRGTGPAGWSARPVTTAPAGSTGRARSSCSSPPGTPRPSSPAPGRGGCAAGSPRPSRASRSTPSRRRSVRPRSSRSVARPPSSTRRPSSTCRSGSPRASPGSGSR